jgi:hypothetical protein
MSDQADSPNERPAEIPPGLTAAQLLQCIGGGRDK